MGKGCDSLTITDYRWNLARNAENRPVAKEISLTALSGEIVTGPLPRTEGRMRRDDVVDAAFETVREVRGPAAAPAQAMRSGMDLLTVAPGRQAAPPPPSSAGLGFWCAGVALALAAFWFAGGHALASRWIGAGADAPVRVAALTARMLHQGGNPLLLLDGTLENAAAGPAPLPSLTINVIDGEGRLTRYPLGKIDGRIAAHCTWRFSSRLEAPRSGVSTVTVTVGGEVPG